MQIYLLSQLIPKATPNCCKENADKMSVLIREHRKGLDYFTQGDSMVLSKSASGFRPVSPAFLLLDFVPVVPVSVRTGRLLAEP
jgi:hypothetical protein